MANKKNTLTNAQALGFALEILKENDASPELIAKIEHMATVANKPKGASETPEAKEMREVLMPATLEFMTRKGEPVTWKQVSENVAGVMTSQKVTAIMRKLIAAGKVTKEYNGRAVEYSLA